MKSDYKRIGNFVVKIKKKNFDNALDSSNLKGINISKYFMPSVANVNGTDLSKYRVVNKWQFAFNPMHVGRDEVLPIAVYKQDNPIIVSPAYVVFEIKNTEILLPEYLMMWCSRLDFDRNAFFMTDSSIRGNFSWNDFCDIELPVPPIEKQREIVREYNIVNDRIKLNENITRNLEDSAHAIYKQWFVDFEFPITKEYAESIGKPELEGNPYKSSGGKMVYSEELDKDIPVGWDYGKLEQLINFSNGKTRPINNGIFPIYGGNGVLGFSDKWNKKDILAIGRVGQYCGSLYRVFDKCWISDNAISAISLENNNDYCFYLLKSLNLNEQYQGTGQPLLTQEILKNIEICMPKIEIIKSFNFIARKISLIISNITKDLKLLCKLQTILLSKLSKV